MVTRVRAATLTSALWLASCTGVVSTSDDSQQGSNEGTSQGEEPVEQGPADTNEPPQAGSGDDSSPNAPSTPDDANTGSSDDDSSGSPVGPIDEDSLSFRQANLTNFESYPAEGSEECVEYNGCEYFGQFAALDEPQSLEWVSEHNIAAVRFDHFEEYANHTLRLRDGKSEIDVVVYDLCSDTDCSGCCTENSSETGFLIDLEVHTAERFGLYDGVVEWACIDC